MNYPSHPIAAVFPMMSVSEFNDLVDDIRKHGLVEPIVIHEGKIVDGRNRYKACRESGVEPRFVEWEGDSLTEWIISKNLHRRHLTASQKATVSIYMMPYLKEEAKERMIYGGGDRKSEEYQKSGTQKFEEPITRSEAAQQAATLTGANRQYVYDAMKIEKESPELLQKVRDGKITIPEAKEQLRVIKGQPPTEPINWKSEYWKLREQVDVIVDSVEPEELQKAIIRIEALLKAKALPR